MDGIDSVERFPVHRSERPVKEMMKNMIYGIIVGVIFTMFNVLNDSSWRGDVLGYIIAGIALSYCGWGAERLWHLKMSSTINRLFSWFAYLTRLPFWYIAGGISYTLSLLVAKKFGLLTVQDIPIKPLFGYGVKIGILLYAMLQIRIYRVLRSIIFPHNSR